MAETEATGLLTTIGAAVVALPVIGTPLRKLFVRTSLNKLAIEQFTEALDREATARESGDQHLSDTLQRMAEADVINRRELYEKLDESTKATTAVNLSLAALSAGNAATLEALKERITKEENRKE